MIAALTFNYVLWVALVLVVTLWFLLPDHDDDPAQDESYPPLCLLCAPHDCTC